MPLSHHRVATVQGLRGQTSLLLVAEASLGWEQGAHRMDRWDHGNGLGEARSEQ